MPVSVTSACTASGSVFSHVTNSRAASTFFDCDVTAVDEPPQLPLETSVPQFGRGAAFQRPVVSAALPLSTPGPQTAPSHPTCVPSFRPAFHSGVYIGLLSMTPSSTRPPQ